MLRGRVARRVFPPEVTAAIQEIACVPPSTFGYHMTQWSARTLSTVIESVVGELVHFTSVAMVLRAVCINLQQLRYCKTATWDEDAEERAVRVLWCYEHAARLREKGELVLCLDEQPNLQILGRKVEKWHSPGYARRQEFEYKRLGVVCLLHEHRVDDGQHGIDLLPGTSGDAFRDAFLARNWELKQQGWRRIHWIMDNAPSHRAYETLDLINHLKGFARVLFIPAHCSWLNQAEHSIGAFSKRYNIHGNWKTRAERIEALPRQVAEYNELFAHQFRWSFTRARFQEWLGIKRQRENHATL